jgi:hypothetical protein
MTLRKLGDLDVVTTGSTKTKRRVKSLNSGTTSTTITSRLASYLSLKRFELSRLLLDSTKEGVSITPRSMITMVFTVTTSRNKPIVISIFSQRALRHLHLLLFATK